MTSMKKRSGSEQVLYDKEPKMALLGRSPIVFAATLGVRAMNSGWAGSLAIQTKQYKSKWVELRSNGVLIVFNAPVVSANGSQAVAQVEYVERVSDARIRERAPFKVELAFAESRSTITLKFSESSEMKKWHAVMTRMMAQRTVQPTDFEMISPLGKGGSGKVFLVRDTMTKEHFAMKVIPKYDAMGTTAGIRHAVDERYVMELARDHEFLVQLRYAFQTDANLYLVSEFYSGGDLAGYLKKQDGHRMEAVDARNMFAEAVMAVRFLHERGIVHRDIKPDNFLISADGHLALGDFGLSRMLESRGGTSSSVSLNNPGAAQFGRASSFCGTREYISPEMARGVDYGLKIDTWALGVLLFRALAGYTPFFRPNQTRSELFRRTRYEDPVFTASRFSETAADLISMLLAKREEDRLTIAEVMTHPFFDGIDWDLVGRPGRPEYGWHRASEEEGGAEKSSLVENFNVKKLEGMEIVGEDGGNKKAEADGWGVGAAALNGMVSGALLVRKATVGSQVSRADIAGYSFSSSISN
eukprot:CAMPEP_0185851622 /NCGR_PEP_ID=MMETSP1354-20130828/10709_1 /TAXON_ID=708628 /ORGANISM="Erythrolobus madagascarensis, Strain CCMP3276" /LENGTH=527 /DNA_ID=CAMNT_0028552651 /DNA_START=80 /DNA_END=1663 /DNA_ORIENTATION=-